MEKCQRADFIFSEIGVSISHRKPIPPMSRNCAPNPNLETDDKVDSIARAADVDRSRIEAIAYRRLARHLAERVRVDRDVDTLRAEIVDDLYESTVRDQGMDILMGGVED